MERPTESVTLPPCAEAQDTLVWQQGLVYSQLFTVIVAQLSRARRFPVTVDSASRTARRLYLGSRMSPRNCADIISTCTVTKPPKPEG